MGYFYVQKMEIPGRWGRLTAVHYILFVVEVFSETTQCFFFVFLFFNYQPWNNYTKAPIIK